MPDQNFKHLSNQNHWCFTQQHSLMRPTWPKWMVISDRRGSVYFVVITSR